MGGEEGDRPVQVGLPVVALLSRDSEDEVDPDGAKARRTGLPVRPVHVLHAVNPAQRPEDSGGKGLHADAQAGEPPVRKRTQPLRGDRPRVRLDRDLGSRVDRKAVPDRGEESAQDLRGKHGGCSASEVDGIGRFLRVLREPVPEQIHLSREKVGEPFRRGGGDFHRVEVAVGAFPHAERDVQVDSPHCLILLQGGEVPKERK